MTLKLQLTIEEMKETPFNPNNLVSALIVRVNTILQKNYTIYYKQLDEDSLDLYVVTELDVDKLPEMAAMAIAQDLNNMFDDLISNVNLFSKSIQEGFDTNTLTNYSNTQIVH